MQVCCERKALQCQGPLRSHTLSLVVGAHFGASCSAALQSEFFEVKTLIRLPLPKVSKVRSLGNQAQALVGFSFSSL